MLEKVIMVTGMPGSGKTVLSEIARELGVPVVIMGDVLRDIARERGLKVDDSSLGKLAIELRRIHGRDVIAKYSLEKAKKLRSKTVLVEGLRNIEEYDFFKEKFKNQAVLVAVHASPKTRFERLKNRGREDDPKSYEEFKKRDRRELEMGIGSVIALADIMFVNEDLTLEEFKEIARENLEKIIRNKG